jgi:chromosomal replication initiator protein
MPDDVLNSVVCLSAVPTAGHPICPSILTILELVAKAHGLSVSDLKAQRRTRVVTQPRQEVMWIAARITLKSTTVIGKAIGGRDHTTVLHGIKMVEQRLRSEPGLRSRLDAIGDEAYATALRAVRDDEADR